MKKKILLRAIIIILLLLITVYSYNIVEKDEGVYISLTSYTDFLNRKDVTIHYIDLETYDTKKIHTFDNEPGYPHQSGVYDLRKNLIYYISKEDGFNDQLFIYDLDLKKSEKITNDLHSIKYIFPTKNNLCIIANPIELRETKLFNIDYKTKQVNEVILSDNFEENEDIDLKKSSLDPVTESIVLSYLFDEEHRQALDDSGSGKTNYVIPPNYSLLLLSKNQKVSKIYETKQKAISKLSFNSDGDILFSELSTLLELSYYTEDKYIEENHFIYNIKTDEVTKNNNTVNINEEHTSDKIYYKNKIYYLYYNIQTNSLWEYDIITKEKRKIISFDSKTTNISNFVLLSKK